MDLRIESRRVYTPIEKEVKAAERRLTWLTIIAPTPAFLYVWQGKDLREPLLYVWQRKELATDECTDSARGGRVTKKEVGAKGSDPHTGGATQISKNKSVGRKAICKTMKTKGERNGTGRVLRLSDGSEWN